MKTRKAKNKKNKVWQLKRCKKYASLIRKGKCLSDNYINSQTKLKWRCENGHMWNAISNCVLNQKTWCKECSDEVRGKNRKKFKNHEEFKNEIENCGFQLVSGRFENAFSFFVVKCKKHEFRTCWNYLQQGFGCRKCFNEEIGKTNRKFKEIKDLKIILKEEFNGELLSDVYENNETKLKIKCENGHIFWSIWGNISQGKWCSECNKERKRRDKTKKDIKKIQLIIKNKNWKLLKVYPEIRKIKIKCENGHITIKTFRSIQKETNCMVCANKGRKVKFSFEEVKNYIQKTFEGKILSKKYENSNKKIKVKCKFEHVFEKSFATIQNGSWCPECSSGISERICKFAFEEIFGNKFTKRKMIKINKTTILELDGYAEFWRNGELMKIAFEHQGEQHYGMRKSFKMNEEDLKKLKFYDRIKKNWCKKNGTILIRIPSLFTRLKIKDLNEFLIKQSKRHKIKIKNVDINKILNKAWLSPYNIKYFKDIKKIVEKKSGKLLTDKYINYNSKFFVECSRGHIFKTSAAVLMMGSFCRKCRPFEEFVYLNGFTFDKEKNKFQAHIKINRKNLKFNCFLGYFKTQKQAFIAHKIAFRAIHLRKIYDKKQLRKLVKKAVYNHLNLLLKIFKRNKKMLKAIEKIQ